MRGDRDYLLLGHCMEILTSVCCSFTEKLVRWCPHVKLRAAILRRLGADLGRNVRVAEVYLGGLWNGFRNLEVGDDSFIGEHSYLDLTGTISIGKRASIAPRCLLLTHEDPGSMLGSKLSELYPRTVGSVHVGDDCWIGAGSTLLRGASVGSGSIIGAGSLVNANIAPGSIAYGVPAKVVGRTGI